MLKPNCRKCIHAGPVVEGSSHHISCDLLENDLESKIILSRDPESIKLKDGTPIFKLSAHGIANGWCDFPFNFDPIWVDSCLVFTADDEEVEAD